MRKHLLSILGFVTLAAMGWAQQTPEASTETTAMQTQSLRLPAGTVIPAELAKSVDAKKAKPGDKEEAKTSMDLRSHGQVVIPRNSKIVGHVTDAKPHSKESPDSKVAIAFDQIAIKDGRPLRMQAAIQAIGRPLQSQALTGNAPMSEGGGMPPTGAPNAGGPMGNGDPSRHAPDTTSPFPSGNASGNSSQATSATVAPLAPTSQGVVGMAGISLSNSGQASVISSGKDNVHLDNGTPLILLTQ
jgi:hypothetical protein